MKPATAEVKDARSQVKEATVSKEENKKVVNR